MQIKRFTLAQRIFHLVLILTFLLLAATGTSRLFIETAWGRGLAGFFGGYEQALHIHKTMGLLLIGLFLVHMLYIVLAIKPERISGPDSLMPEPRDVRDMFRHIGWFIGVSKPPELDRWGYWEKFDYWAVFWGMVIIGGTGLLLYDPVASSKLIPGWGLNIALWVHRIEAILAMGHIFIIHFFIAHLRKTSFPMNMAMFDGTMELSEIRHERPRWYERLEKKGDLERMKVKFVSRELRVISFVFGYAAVITGLYLLISGILNVSGITW